MITRFKTGTQNGTGAAITISLGFKPALVEVENVASGGLASLKAYNHTPAGYAFKTGADGAKTYISSNGITITDYGFIIGADTDVNVDGEAIHWFAI